jgi:hypothetical protein
MMRIIGSEAALITVLLTTSLFSSPALQPGKNPVVDIKPYPGSIAFCTQHITATPGHIIWTGYYSVDPLEKVVSHYTKVLGSENHQKEGDEDVWRFPLAKPERVLSVTRPGRTFLPGECKGPPRSARTIVISSMMARQD